MATRSAGAKDKVKASAASESARATARSGAPEGSRRVGEGEIMPSMDKSPSGRPPKRSRAACRGYRPGVKERAHGSGEGTGGSDQEDASRENGRTETALANQGAGAKTMQRCV